jgi:hypothetical protein
VVAVVDPVLPEVGVEVGVELVEVVDPDPVPEVVVDVGVVLVLEVEPDPLPVVVDDVVPEVVVP